MEHTEIRELPLSRAGAALALARAVFRQYEAPDYPPEGAAEFDRSLQDPAYLAALRLFGAFRGETLAGMIATRDGGRHIALFFVDGAYHRQGIGRQLMAAVRACAPDGCLTVNASPYAVPVYHRLGFCDTAPEQAVNGLCFTPMHWQG